MLLEIYSRKGNFLSEIWKAKPKGVQWCGLAKTHGRSMNEVQRSRSTLHQGKTRYWFDLHTLCFNKRATCRCLDQRIGCSPTYQKTKGLVVHQFQIITCKLRMDNIDSPTWGECWYILRNLIVILVNGMILYLFLSFFSLIESDLWEKL